MASLHSLAHRHGPSGTAAAQDRALTPAAPARGCRGSRGPDPAAPRMGRRKGPPRQGAGRAWCSPPGRGWHCKGTVAGDARCALRRDILLHVYDAGGPGAGGYWDPLGFGPINPRSAEEGHLGTTGRTEDVFQVNSACSGFHRPAVPWQCVCDGWSMRAALLGAPVSC